MTSKSVFSRLKAFGRNDAGSVSVEAVIMFPILLWAFAAMFVFWDAFKMQNILINFFYGARLRIIGIGRIEEW